MLSSTANNNQDIDVSHVGDHCQLASCNRLNFLLLKCDSCKLRFCEDHSAEAAHHCTKPGASEKAKREAALSRESIGANKAVADRVPPGTCAEAGCGERFGGSLKPGNPCKRCGFKFCLTHRLQEYHTCKIEEKKSSAAQITVQTVFGRIKSWSKAKKMEAERVLPKPKPSTAAQRVLAINKLKKSAKGDAKLVAEKRIYVYVEAEAETTTAKFPKGEFFYSADWVVGRVLDAAAKSLQVQNVNNQSSDEKDKLRVFHVEGGRVLEYSEKFGKAVQSGNTVVLLRGVGGPQDLVEM